MITQKFAWKILGESYLFRGDYVGNVVEATESPYLASSSSPKNHISVENGENGIQNKSFTIKKSVKFFVDSQ